MCVLRPLEVKCKGVREKSSVGLEGYTADVINIIFCGGNLCLAVSVPLSETLLVCIVHVCFPSATKPVTQTKLSLGLTVLSPSFFTTDSQPFRLGVDPLLGLVARVCLWSSRYIMWRPLRREGRSVICRASLSLLHLYIWTSIQAV